MIDGKDWAVSWRHFSPESLLAEEFSLRADGRDCSSSLAPGERIALVQDWLKRWRLIVAPNYTQAIQKLSSYVSLRDSYSSKICDFSFP
jgi:hypothetical protein